MERSRRNAGRRKRQYELRLVNPWPDTVNHRGTKERKVKEAKKAKVKVKICFKNLGGR